MYDGMTLVEIFYNDVDKTRQVGVLETLTGNKHCPFDSRKISSCGFQIRYIYLSKLKQLSIQEKSALLNRELTVTVYNNFNGVGGLKLFFVFSLKVHVLSHRGLELDGAIGQGEICNSLKSEKFSKSFLSQIVKNKLKLQKKQFYGYHEAF